MMNHENPPISITLSPAQVDDVVREASQGRALSVSTLISKRLAEPLAPEDGARTEPLPRGAQAREPIFGGYLPHDTEDQRLSRSLLRGLSILTCFGPDGRERGIVELAGDLGMSPSTAHRYALTLVELGLLERCPKTRKYRLAGT
jgi:IclR helix-turn-helix domain